MFSKGLWKQLRETKGLGFAGQVRQDDLDIPTKIPHELAAGTTGSREFIRVGHDNDPDEVVCPFRKRFEQGNPFRTNRKTVAGTFNVAAGEHSSVTTEQR
jgi:hypothetical protein